MKKANSNIQPTYNPNGNNGQYGASYGQNNAAISMPKTPKAANQNGLPDGWYQPVYADLPFQVPTSDFDYMAEHPSDPFFANFFEDHKQEETK